MLSIPKAVVAKVYWILYWLIVNIIMSSIVLSLWLPSVVLLSAAQGNEGQHCDVFGII